MNGKRLKTLLATIIGSVLLTGCGAGSSDSKPAGLVSTPQPTGNSQANSSQANSSQANSSRVNNDGADTLTESGKASTSNSSNPTENASEKSPSAVSSTGSSPLSLFVLPSSFIDTGATIAETAVTEEEKEKKQAEKAKKQPTTVTQDGVVYTVPELDNRTIYSVTKGSSSGNFWVTYKWDNTGAYQNLPWKPGQTVNSAVNNQPPLTEGFDLSSLPNGEGETKTKVAKEVLESILNDVNKNSAGRSLLGEDKKYVLGYGIDSSNNGVLEVKLKNNSKITVGDLYEVTLADETSSTSSSPTTISNTDVYSFIKEPKDKKFLLKFDEYSGSYLGGDQTRLYAFGDKSTTAPSSDLSYRGKAVVKVGDKYHLSEFAGTYSNSAKTFKGMIQGGGLTENLTLNATGVTSETYKGNVTCSSCSNVKFKGQFNGSAHQGTTGVIYTSGVTGTTTTTTTTTTTPSGVFGGSKVELPTK